MDTLNEYSNSAVQTHPNTMPGCSFRQYMHGNPHFAQAVWMLAIGVLPASVYMLIISPSDQEKRQKSIERDPDPENTKQRAKHFEALVKVKEKKDMDPIYNELIRGGTSSKQRRKQPHYANMGTAEPDQRDTHLAKTLGIDVASSTSKDTDTKAQEGQE